MEAVRLAGGSGKWLWPISYQLYLHRTEHLVIVRGTAKGSRFAELRIEGIRKEDNIVGAQKDEDFNF